MLFTILSLLATTIVATINTKQCCPQIINNIRIKTLTIDAHSRSDWVNALKDIDVSDLGGNKSDKRDMGDVGKSAQEHSSETKETVNDVEKHQVETDSKVETDHHPRVCKHGDFVVVMKRVPFYEVGETCESLGFRIAVITDANKTAAGETVRQCNLDCTPWVGQWDTDSFRAALGAPAFGHLLQDQNFIQYEPMERRLPVLCAI